MAGWIVLIVVVDRYLLNVGDRYLHGTWRLDDGDVIFLAFSTHGASPLVMCGVLVFYLYLSTNWALFFILLCCFSVFVHLVQMINGTLLYIFQSSCKSRARARARTSDDGDDDDDDDDDLVDRQSVLF